MTLLLGQRTYRPRRHAITIRGVANAQSVAPTPRNVTTKKCDYEGCGNIFACSSALEAHKRVHTGEQPSVCREDRRGGGGGMG
jgi:uncharacterized Zn-finger protein